VGRRDQGLEGPVGYTEWKVGGRSIGGMMSKPPMMPSGTPSFWGVYFAVGDTDVILSQGAGARSSVLMPATDIEPGRFAVLSDPVGAMLNILALKPELQA